MNRTAWAVFLCLAPLSANAQNSGRIEGPISGVIFDRSSRALRPMIGVPGASYLGPAIAGDLDAAAVSPDGGMALSVSQGRIMLLPSLRPATPATTANVSSLALQSRDRQGALIESEGVSLDAAIQNADQIAWSPDSGSAILYASRTHQAQLLGDVRGVPTPGPAIDVANDVLSLAVSNTGDLLAGTQGGVYLLTQTSAPRLIASAIRPVAMTIRGADLYVADAGADRLWQVRDFTGSADAFVFADGVPSLVGVQISADGKLLFTASSQEKRLTAFDIMARTEVARVDLDCTPTELRSFGGRDLWLLNSTGGGKDPIYVAVGANEPSAWFVPAGREQPEGREQ